MKTVRDKLMREYDILRRGEGQMRINNEYGRVVRLSDPLPCGIWAGEGEICGRPATAAYLDSDPSDAGAYKLRPVCRVCAAAAAAVYSDEGVS